MGEPGTLDVAPVCSVLAYDIHDLGAILSGDDSCGPLHQALALSFVSRISARTLMRSSA